MGANKAGDHGPLTLSREALREVDRLAAERYAIPSIVLMENASHGLADEALAMIARDALHAVVILCGPGANAGDGFALARHLHNAHVPVLILLTRPPESYKGDALTNLTTCQRMGLTIEPPPATGADVDAWIDAAIARHRPEADDRSCLLVDALFGTGLDRPPEGVMLALIRAINARRPPARVLCVDVPSGLDADTGRVLGDAVNADVTVTFVARKRGFAAPGAAERLGRVVVAPIGAPRELVESLADPG
ncbi:MAG: NAD(P)H-hydrate epimerase [Phycisphaerales bacterium]